MQHLTLVMQLLLMQKAFQCSDKHFESCIHGSFFYFFKLWTSLSIYQSMPASPSTATRSRKSTRTNWDYTIEQSRFGLYTSVLTDGTRMVCGLTEEGVRSVTDNVHIPVMKGEFTGYTSQGRSSVVAGKL